jgi:hypothetical protein
MNQRRPNRDPGERGMQRIEEMLFSAGITALGAARTALDLRRVQSLPMSCNCALPHPRHLRRHPLQAPRLSVS